MMVYGFAVVGHFCTVSRIDNGLTNWCCGTGVGGIIVDIVPWYDGAAIKSVLDYKLYLW